MRKHNPTLFIECLATEIVETYQHFVGISEQQEKQCLQRWRQNSDFSCFLKINILIIFFPEQQATQQLLIGLKFVSLTFSLR